MHAGKYDAMPAPRFPSGSAKGGLQGHHSLESIFLFFVGSFSNTWAAMTTHAVN